MFEDIKKTVAEILPISYGVKDSEKEKAYNLRKIERITIAIDKVGDFNLETDKITATDYKTIKDALNGLNFSGFRIYLNTLGDFKTDYEIFQKYPYLSTISYEIPSDLYRITPNKIAKLKKMKNGGNAIEIGAIDHVIKRLEMFIPLAEKVAAMKDCIGKKETKKETKQKEIEYIRGNIDEKLKGILEEIAESFRLKVEKDRIAYYERRLNNYDKNKVKRYSDIQEIEMFVTYPGYDLKPNAMEMIPAKAKKDSNEIIQDFVYKMYLKLGGLIINFPGVQVDYDGSVYRNRIKFVLSKDTYFTVENSIVTGVSHLGTWFNRYPTTFHNVVIDGEKVKTPSEFKVKQLLNIK